MEIKKQLIDALRVTIYNHYANAFDLIKQDKKLSDEYAKNIISVAKKIVAMDNIGKDKLCLYCKHFYFDGGSPGYSELTPGSDWDMHCYKDVWKLGGRKGISKYDLTQDSYIELIETANKCEHYFDIKVDKLIKATCDRHIWIHNMCLLCGVDDHTVNWKYSKGPRIHDSVLYNKIGMVYKYE